MPYAPGFIFLFIRRLLIANTVGFIDGAGSAEHGRAE